MVELAESRGIPVLAPERARDPDFAGSLRALEPELLLVASYGQILDQALLDLAPKGAFNVHASLLPRHRGASPIQAAIRNGDPTTGVSVQRMVLALDEGDVLLALETRIGESEKAGELTARLAELGAEAAVLALDRVAEGRDECEAQDPAGVTYAKRLTKEQGWIDWGLPAEEIARHLRSVTPWPGARARLANGKEITLTSARVVEFQGSEAPGTLLETGPRLVVRAGQAALELLELTPAGKRGLSAADWLRGARLEIGQSFERSGRGAPA